MFVKTMAGEAFRLTHYTGIERVREVNGAFTFSFYLLKTPKNEHAYDFVENENIIIYQGVEYVIKKIGKRMVGKRTAIQVQCEFKPYSDLIDDWQYDVISGTKNITQAMTHALATTGYTFNVFGAFAAVEFEKFGDDTPLSLIQTIIDRYGAEFIIEGTNVKLYNRLGVDTNSQFRYRHNIKTISANIDTGNFATYIKGFGKDGLEVEYTSPLAATYGIRHAPPVRDERFTDSENLLSECQKRLDDEFKVSLEIDYVEIKKNGTNINPFDLGDGLFLIHDEMGFKSLVRVLAITDYPESDKQPKLKLSNIEKDARHMLANLNETRRAVKQLTDADGNLQLTIKKLYRNSNHFSDNTGDWYISPDDANAFVHIGAGGVDIHKGLLRVERADGYAYIVGGAMQNGFGIQGAYPPFRTAGVSELGPWLRTLTTSRFENIQSFTFKHDSRYLVARIGMYTDGGITGNMVFDLDTSDGDGETVTTIGTVTRSSNDDGWTTYVTMDLGVPTGERKTLYVRMFGSADTYYVYGRIMYISQEG